MNDRGLLVMAAALMFPASALRGGFHPAFRRLVLKDGAFTGWKIVSQTFQAHPAS